MDVTCLCALWCDSCEAYREGFLALAKEFPRARFRWLDIEDDAEAVGSREVENFPTVLVERDGMGRTEQFVPIPVPGHGAGELVPTLVTGVTAEGLVGEALRNAA